MKKNLLFFIALIVYINILGQTTDIFPDSNVVWGVQESSCCPVYIEDSYDIVTKRDTVINGNTYEIIGVHGTKLRDYAVREDTSKRVWIIYLNRLIQYGAPNDSAYSYSDSSWVYKLSNDSTEYLLYDFNIQDGDTISIYIPPFSQSAYSVNFPVTGGFVRFLIIGGYPQECVNNVYRDQYYLYCIEPDSLNGNTTYYIQIDPWIEGVGALSGGPVYTETFCFFEHMTEIMYVYENGNQIFPCVSEVNEMKEELFVECYPNPGINKITIESRDKITRIEIVDNLGQIVFFVENVNDKTINVSTADLISGIYIVKICVRNQAYTRKFIKN
jgi:hypothetical protein